ncbi:hypothetical protein BV25DRAFT_1804969, partial [Artomyces pyxidatus]
RDTYLEEMIRLDGLGEHEILPGCEQCGDAPGAIRCTDCVGGLLLCADCAVLEHAKHPYHRVERWNGDFFEKYSLREAGLIIQLGHDGRSCPRPLAKNSPLTVIDISGVHEVQVQYCDCGRIGSSRPIVQLLRASLWPATVDRPQTATTLRTLKLFHSLTLQGKMNAYDFWCGLVRITDGMGTRKTKYRYKEFIRSVRCFRHLRAAKRAGRAHDPEGIEGTQPGEFVVECPLCPHPGRNMPEGWEDAPEHEKWKHAMFVAVDANFKLKLKNRGLSDVELSPGWAYFVNSTEYAEYLKDYVDEPEVKYCESNHSAINDANVPAQRRFIVNGVGAVVCSRHYFYLKHCIGDLQFGERYSSMDYMLLSSLALSCPDIKSLFISYDIACSFSVNFESRMEQQPESRKLDLDLLKLKWAIPKFHLLAHGAKCQGPYSYNTMFGVGRTHGEGIETGWADLNGAALSTREMAGAARHEILDDVLGAINWRKLIAIGMSFNPKNLIAAVVARDKHQVQLEETASTVPAETIELWNAMMVEYENNKKAFNPYEEPVTTTSQVDVRLELAEEEAEEARQGQLALHETTASAFLAAGFELEEQQYVPSNFFKQPTARASKPDKMEFRDKQNVLRHRISAWRQIQQLYMPCISQLVVPPTQSSSGAPDDVTESNDPEKVNLYLPSQIPAELRAAGCTLGLADKELRLRRGQAEDALHQVRRSIRMRIGMIHYKHVHVDGQGVAANTRARTLVSRISDKLRRHVRRYRAAYAALLSLSPDGDWKVHLRQLREEDIRSAREDERALGEGHRELSWIWRVLRPEARDFPEADEETTEEELNDSVRVDYVTSKARVDRWEEEIIHLSEEMPRAVRFFRDRARWWRSKVDQRRDVSPDILSGLNAFAERQAKQLEDLTDSFLEQWIPVVNSLGVTVAWPEDTPTSDQTSGEPPQSDQSDSDSSSSDSDIYSLSDTHSISTNDAGTSLGGGAVDLDDIL